MTGCQNQKIKKKGALNSFHHKLVLKNCWFKLLVKKKNNDKTKSANML